MPQFPAVIALSTLNGSTGFRIDGEAAGNYAGFSVSSAGDINGDGFADIIIGADAGSPNGLYSGISYIVFGKASGFSPTFQLSSLSGGNGFQINGEAAYGFARYSAARAGDLHGDRFTEFIGAATCLRPHGIRTGAPYLRVRQAWNL